MTANHTTIAERAKAKPMRWTFVRQYGTADSAAVTASNIRRGTRRPYEPRGAFEARAVGTRVSVRFRG